MAETVDTRAMVLAWMATHGVGASAAAKHFGLNAETVKSWWQRRNKKRAREEGAPEGGEVQLGGVQREEERVRVAALAGAPPSALPPPRARAIPPPATAAGEASKSRGTPSKPVQLAGEDREKAVAAVRLLLSYLSDPNNLTNPLGMSHASRALTEILRAMPDLMSLDVDPEKAAGVSVGDAVKNALARRDAAKAAK